MSAPTDAPGSRALLLGPIEHALEHARAPDGPSDEDAHEARKSLKRARAALRVLRTTLGERAYRRENAALRDASRGISVLRDAKAQLDVLASIRDRYARRWPVDELAPLEQGVHAELDRLRAGLQRPESDARRAVELIEKSRRRIVRRSNSVLKADDIYAALAAIYRRGRKRFRQVMNGAQADALHEWRKQTKYLSNAIQLTSNGNAGERDTIAKRAKRLADRLGDDHDLAVLAERVVHDEPVLGALTASRLQQLIERRREQLRRNALRLGAKVYGRKPSRAFDAVDRREVLVLTSGFGEFRYLIRRTGIGRPQPYQVVPIAAIQSALSTHCSRSSFSEAGIPRMRALQQTRIRVLTQIWAIGGSWRRRAVSSLTLRG